MRKALIIFILLVQAASSYAQSYTYSGVIADQKTKKKLAFVSVYNTVDKNGVQTDIDGKFTITGKAAELVLRVQYVGYEPQQMLVKSGEPLFFFLVPKQNSIREVQVVAGENPAHRIIRKVIENKAKNNPEELASFQYMSYNKFIFSGKADTGLARIDSAYRVSNAIKKLDSTDRVKFEIQRDSIVEAYQKSLKRSDSLFSTQHIFMTETVTERKYLKPAQNKEEVKAVRVSGLKAPQFALIASQFQSFSFYNDEIKILDKTYSSPISKGSTNRYFFSIEDTLYDGKDSIFVITYKPRKGKNFDGLKGLLYIHTNGYAIQNVIAEPFEPSKYFYIRTQQHFEFKSGVWFPIQLNTDLEFAGVQFNNRKAYGVGRTYITDIQLGTEMRKREFDGVVLEFDKKSIKTNNDSLLSQYRPDTLDDKEKKTYVVMDSVGKAERFDEKLFLATTIAQGYVPLGKYLRVDLNRILSTYNDFEGLRLGLGLSTSPALSKHFTLGSYFAWGTKDNTFKYGANINVPVWEKREVFWYSSAYYDVLESGSTSFRQEKLSTADRYRNLLIANMDFVRGFETRFSFRSNRYLLHHVYYTYNERQVTTPYQFIEGAQAINQFNYFELGLTNKWAFGETFMRQAGQKISLGTKYPTMFFNLSLIQGLNSTWSKQLIKYDVKVLYDYSFRTLGVSHIQLHGGYIQGDAPYPFAYNGRANYNGRFSLVSQGYFETMFMNEFLSSSYASVFFMHDFRKLLFRSKYFNPGISVSSAAGWGTLNNVSQHNGTAFKTMEKGYYESGISVRDILVLKSNLYSTGFGIGAFYRYGPYQMPSEIDNLALKMNFTISF